MGFSLSKFSLFTLTQHFLVFQGERKEEEMKMLSFSLACTLSILKG
jgi:hypothetical protein